MDLPDAELDALKRRAKRQIRARARALRSAIPERARTARSLAVVDRLLALSEVRAARAVALFWPIEGRGEVDLRTLDRELRRTDKAVFYPFAAGGAREGIGFGRVDDPAELAVGENGFSEPPEHAASASPSGLDVVVVPALAVAAQGQRLGFGAGFYDSILPVFCPPAVSVVVAYDFELLPELPSTEGDVSCDVVVTDLRTIRVR